MAAAAAAEPRAAGFERAEEPGTAAAAVHEAAAVHRRDNLGGLPPGTPAAQSPAPPMARYPVIEDQHGGGAGVGAHV